MFYGRKNEINSILEEIEQEKRSFISIIGRRGVGKTYLMNYLIHNYFNLESEENLVFYFEGLKNTKTKDQINNFLFEIKMKLNQDKKFISILKKTNPTNWFEVFSLFAEKINKIKDRKIVIFIDEFAWFQNKQSNFLESFGSFWNKLSFSSNVNIIIASSAVSWMNENVIKNKGSLYHKITLNIKLKPFSLKETFDFLLKRGFFKNEEIFLRYYLITGGVVRYLEKANLNLSFEENAVNIFSSKLNEEGLEFNELFNQTFNSNRTNIHKKIINLFQNKKSLTIKEILPQINETRKTISKALEDLVVSDILTVQNNFEKNKHDKIYFLTDLFCLSYVKIIKDQILSKKLFENQRFSIMKGYLFETIMFLNSELIKETIQRAGFETKEFSVSNKEAQIDMIMDYGNNHLSIIECKYYNDDFIIDKEMQRKMLNRRDVLTKILKENKVKKFDIDFIFVSFYKNKTKDKLSGFSTLNISLEELLKV